MSRRRAPTKTKAEDVRLRAHIRIAAALFVLFGVLCALAAVLTPSLSTAAADAVAASGEDGADIGAALIAWTGRTITIGTAVLSVPSLVCGWGLLRRCSWARWLGIFLAAIAVIQIPVGTIAGGYILWVLLSKRFEPWFDEPAVTHSSR